MMSIYRIAGEHPSTPLNAAERLTVSGAEEYISHLGPCPKCGAAPSHPKLSYYERAVLKHRACRGGIWSLTCDLKDLHLHARCLVCGAQWVMLPKDADFGASGTGIAR